MSDQARRQAQAALRRTRQHLSSLVEQHTRVYAAWFDLCERSLSGDASFSEIIETSLSLAQDCYAKLSSCVASASLVADDQFDQMSEAAGPHIIAAGGAAMTSVSKLPPVRFNGPGNSSVDANDVLIRQLSDGRLHVTLMALDQALPDGTYSADIQAQSTGLTATPLTEVTATKMTRARVALPIALGDDVPSYLKNDPKLDLVRLLFK